MKGPFSYTASLDGGPGTADIVPVKRTAIDDMRRATKTYGEGAKGEVRDSAGHLVKQVEAYRTKGGAIKLRDLTL